MNAADGTRDVVTEFRRLDPAPSRRWIQEREFGRVVGLAFLAVAGLVWTFSPTGTIVAAVAASLGSGLLALGTLAPRALVWPRRVWMAVATGLAFVSTRVVLGLVFFAVVTPIGVVKRATGWDPLRRRGARGDTEWMPYSRRQSDPRHYEKMF